MAIFTWDQIANQLTDGFWNNQGGARHAFDVTVDRDISVDLSRLSANARTIALDALNQWGIATGINFVETSPKPTVITETTDIGNSTARALNISTNIIVNGSINPSGDSDYYKVTLVAGQTYLIGMSNLATGSSVNARLELLNSAGSVLVFSDDPSNPNAGEYITFTAATTGTYYVVADGFSATRGAYELSIQTAADITFNDMDGSGAYAYSDITGNNIARSYINIPDNWSTMSMNGYMLQTYIHEIGHALGLGHAGNYNGSASYPADALYENDSWLASIMSYFTQTDNTLVPNDSFAFLATIMPADIIAIQDLYGAGPPGYQTGNTVWGPGGSLNNTLQTMLDMAAGLIPADPLYFQNQPIAFTIYDTGGTDTLDLSAFNNNSEILLTELQYSNVRGLVDNVVIARGTEIENAIGGAAGETITGNNVANIIEGRGGIDSLYGAIGNDTLIGGLGNDVMTGGADNDSFIFNVSELAVGQADTVTDFVGGATGAGDTLRLVGIASGNVSVTASGGSASLSYDNGAITNTVALQAVSANPLYVHGYSTLANAQSGNLANGFIFVTDATNETANSWTRQIRSFDAAAATDWINTFNDNGSRLFQDFDNFDALSWNNVEESYDSLNRIASRDTINDDASRSKQYFDHLSNQTWTSVTDAFSSGNVLQNEVTAYDNGTRTASYFDWQGDNGWSSIVDTFNNSNALQTETANFDGGSRSVQFFDHLINQAWTSILQNFDNLNRLMNETTNYDNGIRQVNYLDYQINQNWINIVDVFSSGSVLQTETTNYDNGTRQVFYNDWQPGGTNAWTSITDLFDNLNRPSVETVRYDTGNRIETDFDQNTTNNANGEFTWAKDVYTYNATNVLIQHYQIMDDGSTLFL